MIEKNWERQMSDAVEYALNAMKVRLDGKDGKETPPPGTEEDEEIYTEESVSLAFHCFSNRNEAQLFLHVIQICSMPTITRCCYAKHLLTLGPGTQLPNL